VDQQLKAKARLGRSLIVSALTAAAAGAVLLIPLPRPAPPPSTSALPTTPGRPLPDRPIRPAPGQALLAPEPTTPTVLGGRGERIGIAAPPLSASRMR